MNDNLKKPTAENAFSTPIVKDIFGVSADFLGQFRTWLEQNPPAIPVSQIVGFNQFTVQSATKINTSESTTSTSYTNLATTGPTLSGLPDGKYLVLFGAAISTPLGSGHECFMNVSENGASLSTDNNALQGAATGFGVGGVSAYLTTLANDGNNTLTAKYRTANAAATAGFNHRWLIAIKYANS